MKRPGLIVRDVIEALFAFLESPAAVALLLLLLILISLSACSIAPPTVKTHEGIAYIDAPGVPCPDNPSTGGCIEYRPTIYRPVNDAAAEAHELEHLLGMRHGPWMSYGTISCAIVTISGTTNWKIGDLMCRVHSGRIEIGGK